ncbi:MAG: DUF4412 domain-containing protein, partial [Saprospiraceae bacterium]
MDYNCFQLTYNQDVFFKRKDENYENFIDKDNSLNDEEREEKKQTIKEGNILLKRIAENARKTIYKFTIGAQKIRVERIFPNKEHGIKETFQIIDKEKRNQKTYKLTDENEIQLYSSSLNRSKEFEFKFDYDLETKKDDTKIILGFKCHKIIIKERCHDLKNDILDENTIECYVTEKIDFPLHYLGFISKPITKLCALEMTIYRLNNFE